MKKLLTTFLLLTYGICSGQNLVQNGDFEQYWGCPDAINEFDSVKMWVNPTLTSPDYYNGCGTPPANVPNVLLGFQQAESGVAFAGIFIWSAYINSYREYIEAPLVSPLVSGTCYNFQMYINLSNHSKYSSDKIGVYFSDTLLTENTWIPYILPVTAQINNTIGNFPDTLNWTLVSGSYIANGGENYITIGNFNDENSTFDSIFIVNPTGSGDLYIFIDNVSLTVCPDNGIIEPNQTSISVYPNPIADELKLQINNYEPTEIILYDLSSRKLLQQTFTNTTTLNTEQLAKGMYLYTVRNRNGIIKNGKVIKQ